MCFVKWSSVKHLHLFWKQVFSYIKFILRAWVSIYKTTYKLFIIIILIGLSYPARDLHIIIQSFVINAPLP
jgi:hypothetical protein